MKIFEPMLANTWRVIESYGLDAMALCKSEGLEVSLPLDPNKRISFEQHTRIRMKAATLSGDPYFYLQFAKQFHPGDIGALGFAWIASESLYDGFLRLERYIRMVNLDAWIEIAVDTDRLVVTHGIADEGSTEPLHAIGTGAWLYQLCKMHRDRPFELTAMNFRCKKPRMVTGFQDFFGCPLAFDQNMDQLIMPATVARQKIPHSSPQLAALHDRVIDQYLDALDRTEIASQVRAGIIALLPDGKVTVDKVAAQLLLSPRTLRRQLLLEGETFKNIFTQTRKELAIHYMEKNSLPLSEIAFLLGFSELSAFSRAYKSWFGVSPSEMRANQVNQLLTA
jgi:AraC-like DNA-binding protein